MFNINRFFWALRKVRLPIHANALVLDVGSGGNPFPRSDVLLDRLTGDDHRNGESMMIDRACVFGDASRMPFKDKVFDFVIASHILEHMSHPEIFLSELQRVGKAGYIETPSALFERLYPYHIHCLEVEKVGDVLHINKKNQAVFDEFLGTKGLLAANKPLGRIMADKPEIFHVQHFWSKKIKFIVHNPEVCCKWIEEINNEKIIGQVKNSYLVDVVQNKGWRDLGMACFNAYFSFKRKKRLKDFDLQSILACPNCLMDLSQSNEFLTCKKCKNKYPLIDGIPNFG